MKTKLKLTLSALLLIPIVFSGKVSAQKSKKDATRTVIITNGDTIINGKNIRDANKKDQTRLRKEFSEMNRELTGKGLVIKDHGDKDIDFNFRKHNGETNTLFWKDDEGDKAFRFRFKHDPKNMRNIELFTDSMIIAMDGDSTWSNFDMKPGDFRKNIRSKVMTMDNEPFLRFSDPESFHRMPGFPPMEREQNNSQVFTYTNTDKDGFSNRMSIRINEVSAEQFKKITGAEANKEESNFLEDLTLFPSFSTGKILLSFNLKDRGNMDVKVLDSDIKVVFSDRAANFSGNYSKQISIPKNGLYYLAVNQNGKWVVRKISKK
ncbi:MAG: hypothetical protein WBP45_01205 [Daejeonella sp.]